MLTKTRQWGNSLAVIIPKRVAEELGLRANDEIDIKLEKRANILKELFGGIKLSKPTEQLLKEARKNISRWE